MAIFTFENFIRTPSNSFVYESVLSAIKEAGKKYNPILLCGENGYGKSHLLKACEDYIVTENNNAKCCYITAEVFTSNGPPA